MHGGDVDLKEASAAPCRHPWETARRTHFLRLLLPALAVDAVEILDFGAGDGWFAGELARARGGLRLTCVDANYREEDLRRLQETHPRLKFGSRLEGRDFDAVLALDVLEHLEDDAFAFHRLVEAGRPGALLLVSVPGWPRLFGPHDRYLGHFRRYRLRGLTALATAEPVDILRRGGLFTSLLLGRCLLRWLRVGEGKGPDRSDAALWRGGRTLAAIVHACLTVDGLVHRIAAKLGVPLPGLSWWILCRKR